MAYEAGTAFLQIQPSFSGVVRAISEEAQKWGDEAGVNFSQSFKNTVKQITKDTEAGPSDSDTAARGSSAGAKFADAFKARVDAALKSLPDASVDLNDEEAKLKLDDIRARLETLRGIDVGVDIKDVDALAAIEILKGELDELAAKNPTARVDLAGAASVLGEIEGLKLELDSYGAKDEEAKAGVDASEGISSVSGLISAILALGPAAVAAAAVATAALAAIPAVLGGIGIGGAAAFLGLAPVIKGLTQVPKAAGGAAGGMNQVASSANSMALAQLNAAHSAEQAAQQVVSAQQAVTASEQSLANAQQSERQAQLNLTAAREAAANQLQTYQDQLKDGVLQSQQLQLNLQSAQQSLTTAQNNGVSGLPLAQAQLAVAQATQAIQDQKDQYGQLQDAATKAFAAGVDGATNVVSAQQSLASAQQGVSNAATALTNAQDGVTKALANQDYQAKVTAINLQQAALSGAAAGAAAGASAPKVSALGGAFTTLTAVGQQFTDWIKSDLLPKFSQASAAAQNGLLPGIEDGLKAMAPIWPVIVSAIGQAAQGIGDFVRHLGMMGGKSDNVTKIAEIFASGASLMDHMSDAFLNFIQAVTNIGSQAQPIVDAIGSGIVNLSKAFLNWTTGPGFKNFVDWITKNGPVVAKTVHDILNVIVPLIPAFAKVGIAVLKVVDPILKWVGSMLKAHPVIAVMVAAGLMALGVFLLLAPAIAAITWPMLIAVGVIGVLAAAIYELATHWKTVFPELKRIVEPVWKFLENDVFHPLVDFFTTVIPPALDALSAIWSAVWPVIKEAVKVAWDVMKVIFDAIVVIAVVPLGLAIIAFRDIWLPIWPAIHGALTTAWGIMQPIFGFIISLGIGLIEAGITVLGTAWSLFWSTFHEPIQLAWDLIKPMINLFIDGINALITAADVVPGVNIPHVPHIGDGPPPPPTGAQIDHSGRPGGNLAGGDVQAGVPIRVGELAPEIFVPAVDGTILNHHQIEGLGKPTQRGPVVSIGQATFKNEADVEMLNRKASFALMAGRL